LVKNNPTLQDFSRKIKHFLTIGSMRMIALDLRGEDWNVQLKRRERISRDNLTAAIHSGICRRFGSNGVVD
jgi:hypothetical protein